MSFGLSLSFGLVGPLAKADSQAMFGALLNGPPKLAQSKLDPAAYVETKVKKLAHAQIAYVNWRAIDSLIEELGFESPPTT